MILTKFLELEHIRHHKIPSKNNTGIIVKCDFEVMRDTESYDDGIKVILKVCYRDKNFKEKHKTIKEYIEYLDFVE